MNCVINNGLSEASKEQLKHKTGEEIVDADVYKRQASLDTDMKGMTICGIPIVANHDGIVLSLIHI